MKLKATVKIELIYEADPDHYPSSTTVAEMCAVDKENFDDDLLMVIDMITDDTEVKISVTHEEGEIPKGDKCVECDALLEFEPHKLSCSKSK